MQNNELLTKFGSVRFGLSMVGKLPMSDSTYYNDGTMWAQISAGVAAREMADFVLILVMNIVPILHPMHKVQRNIPRTYFTQCTRGPHPYIVTHVATIPALETVLASGLCPDGETRFRSKCCTFGWGGWMEGWALQYRRGLFG
jgi:hypothetical protein